MFYIYSTIYNSYTAAGESVWGPGVFLGFTTKGVSMASPVAGTELSLFISFMLVAVAQWDCGSSAPVSVADNIKRHYIHLCWPVDME